MEIRERSGPATGAAPYESDGDSELEAERAFMRHARRSMDAMRRSVEALKPQAANRVDKEILEAKLAQRLASLRDDPEVPLFFGRIDAGAAGRSGPSGPMREAGETFHIGRRHVKDIHGDPVVVDWRADVAMPFYRATRRDPVGLTRRRRFGFSRGEITGMEDELLELGGLEEAIEGLSPLVAAEIERPRTGPMRDIVATIQPEQDEIVRAGLTESICVQGGPATGKTAVGLHRAAYLLHAYAAQLRERGILVVGPSDAFIRYIGAVLPSLGEVDVDQVPLQDLLAQPRVGVRAPDDPEVAALKHDPRMAAVIRRATQARMAPPDGPLAVRVGATPVELEPRELERIRIGALPAGDVAGAVARQVAASLERPGSIGVIVPPVQRSPVAQALSGSGTEWGSAGEIAGGRRVTLLEATKAKGLEFDVVVLVEPEALARSGETAALRLLYIAVTRAVLRLVVVHSDPLPDQLVRG